MLSYIPSASSDTPTLLAVGGATGGGATGGRVTGGGATGGGATGGGATGGRVAGEEEYGEGVYVILCPSVGVPPERLLISS